MISTLFSVICQLSRPFAYSRYRTGTSMQSSLMRGVFSNANDIISSNTENMAKNLFLMLFPCMGLHSKLVPVRYRECDINLFLKLVPVQYRVYDINLFLMIFFCMSLHCKLVPVQYRENDINLFLMILPRTSFHSKLVPVQYREYTGPGI